jgi:hypothetical protein
MRRYVVPVLPEDTILVDAGSVLVKAQSPWADPLEVYGEPADLIRLSDALRQAALRAIDAKVATAREVAS